MLTIVRSLAIVLFTCAVAAAQTATTDPVYAGYMRLYAGERDAAYKHFEALRAKDPTSLAAGFGLLFAHEARVEYDASLGPSFEKAIQEFLDQADQRYARSKADTEALFYLAQAHLLRSTYRIDQDKGVFGAARDAAKAKSYSETYIKQHPEHGDAYLALGLYNYYVDIAPNFIKVLRVLLFLPAGGRAEGLKQIERAGREGSLFAPLAEGALADIYGEFEGRLSEAISIGERLVRRFPSNAELRFDLAERYMHPTVEAYDRAAELYTGIIEQKKSDSVEDLEARYRATIGLANLRRSQWRLDEAIALLTPAIEQSVAKPEWVLPTFLIRRSNYRALLNDAGAAADSQRVLGDKRMATWHKAAQGQITFIEGRKNSAEAIVYTALVPGNRDVVEHRWDDAVAVYDKVEATHRGDWQVKYRRGYLEFMRANYDVAARVLNEIVLAKAPMPAWLKAQAMLNLAWTHDLAGRRAEALRLYKQIVDDYEREAASNPARVGLISPYRRG
jgi:tetratricopeptide repeat protein